MDWTTIVAIASGVSSVITTATLIWNLLSSSEKKLELRLEKVETSIADHEKRLGGIEGEMRHLPTRESQHRIEMNMAEINTAIAVLNESLKPIRANAELVNDLLRAQVTK